MEAFKKKYGIDKHDGTQKSEIKILKKIILQTKINLEMETCFTLSYYGEIKPGKIEKLNNTDPIRVYEAEIADDESITEYYYLDLDALNDADENESDENEMLILVLEEIDPREAPSICE